MVMFTFSGFDCKYLFGQIWSKNSKLLVWAELLHWTNLNMQNYVENMWCSLFCFRPEKPFLNKSGQKNQNCQLKQKFGTKRLIWICGIQWWCSLFLFLTINIFLGQIWFKSSKLFVQNERLIRICNIQWWYLFYLF